MTTRGEYGPDLVSDLIRLLKGPRIQAGAYAQVSEALDGLSFPPAKFKVLKLPA
jgi:hypothetical protein